MMFGDWVDSELDKVKAKTDKSLKQKREMRLRALLSEREAQRFADPARLFK